jgi:glycerol-3-phosphate acyltransferase PlsY
MRVAWALTGGYLLGSVLTADVVARVASRKQRKAIDVRAVGSGNPGAANVAANVGSVWGAAVLAGDTGKGALASLLGWALAGPAGAYAAGAAAVTGHCYPIFQPRRGGKGLATSLGTAIVLFPIYVPIDVGLAAAAYVRWRHAAFATIAASCAFVVATLVWARFRLPNAWGPPATVGLPAYALLTSAVSASRFAGRR